MRKLCLSPRGLLKWVHGERVSGVCHLLAFPGACAIPSLSQLPRHVHIGSGMAFQGCGLVKGASFRESPLGCPMSQVEEAGFFVRCG